MPRAFGKYQLLEKIAVGGMAEIYKAKYFGAAGFEKVMVMKQILPQYAQDPDFIKMFIDEAKIAVSLSHGNIVPVYELGKTDGVYFIAMEYIDGKNLGEILERSAKSKKPMPTQIALHVTMEICKGLDYAHRKAGADGASLHIIHRDISPQNILVSYDGDVKIVDFGIAKAIYSSQTTKAGVIKGKFGYMSPEQARGQPLDSRSDLFSSGILLFEMLTGARLFSTDSEVETLENVKMAKVPSPSRLNPRIPPMLDKIVFKALAKEPDDRYQSADDLQKALAKFLYSQGWEVSTNTLAKFMGDVFPHDERKPEESSGGRDTDQIATSTSPSASAKANGKEPPMTEREDPTRRVPLEQIGAAKATPAAPPPPPAARVPTPSAAPMAAVSAAAPMAAVAPTPSRKAPLVGPPELEAALAESFAEPAAPTPGKRHTSPGFELAREVPAKEPAGVIEAAEESKDDVDLKGAEALLIGGAGAASGRAAVPAPAYAESGPEPKRSLAVPVLVIAIVSLLGVIALLLAKFAPTLSPEAKRKKAEEETKRMLAERDRAQPVYGRARFTIEPEAVDFFWNGQKHPDSPTKSVVVQELDISQVYKVRLEVPKKPGQTAMLWYPKELTITQSDWKVIEGLNIYQQEIRIDPTPENKEALEKMEQEKREKEEWERRDKRKKKRDD
jgi:serine/threonine protein kinase